MSKNSGRSYILPISVKEENRLAHVYMPLLLMLLCSFLIVSCSMKEIETEESSEGVNFAMVIHGGAGTITRENLSDEIEARYREVMDSALTVGEDILKNGGSSVDAVVETIKIMENSSLFNAGKGAVFTHEGRNEMDASIMVGNTMDAGAVGGVRRIKNPITAARAVLEHSEHVLLIGKGAEEFAETQNLNFADTSYFHTDRRWNSLQRILKSEENKTELDHDATDRKHGTVGAVALDKSGNITAGTSTGGMTNKRYNRIGDTPIIGAGTYANNKTCGVSSTGHGEYFIRFAVAHDISALMEYKNIGVKEAANQVVMEKLKEKGGSGGVIALDAKGNIAMPFNTEGMYRGYVKPGERVIKIYKD